MTDPIYGILTGFPGKSVVGGFRFLIPLTLFLAVGCGVESRSPEEADTSLELGRALYGQWCQTCHGDVVTGAGADPTAPSHGPNGHTWHHPDGQLEAIILGQFTYPARTMPSFESQLSKEETTAILAYLKEGWTAQQREAQAEASKKWEEYQNSSP